jgi:hypothetical protein
VPGAAITPGIAERDQHGHSTVGASLRYQHIVNGRDAEIAAALSALAAKPKLAVVADEPA